MNVTYLPEPNLEFGGAGQDIDIRFGLMNNGVFDRGLATAPSKLRLGVIGTPQTIESFLQWINRCRTEIPAKETDLKNLFPAFPGFCEDHTFYSTIVADASFQRTLSSREMDILTKSGDFNKMIEEVVSKVLDEVRYLDETSKPDVIVCAMPKSLHDRIADKRSEGGGSVHEFHDLLKARGLIYRVPLQLIWPHTYDASQGRMKKGVVRTLQDEATRAWNLHAALYYKAGGLPYRLVRGAADFDTCFVGISFYKTIDKTAVMTSMAQVFNQRGEGVIVRGGPAELSKEDKEHHLSEADAYLLLYDALQTYRKEHRNSPARVVVHKTTNYSVDELQGFNSALKAQSIEIVDLVSLRNSFIRLFRKGDNPPLRGTLLMLDDTQQILYTRGSIPFYQTYPGMYVPRTLHIKSDEVTSSSTFIANEILSLTKLNYNDTQLDGGAPMTIRAAKKVGSILRYVEPKTLPVSHFKFYM